MLRGYVRLFQYGSNMDPNRLNAPDRLRGQAKREGTARLDGWGIRFDLFSKPNGSAVTDIVKSQSEHVLGVVYQVPARLICAPPHVRSRMDCIEGAKLDGTGNYEKQRMSVLLNNRPCLVYTYIGTEPGRRRFRSRSKEDRRVSTIYFEYLMRGARHFPNDYRAYLKQRAGSLKQKLTITGSQGIASEEAEGNIQ
ncbi:MAG: hypothetical protein A3J28_16185 [Acidobacteria bacterium RIFCSPLOWO2_12_FULL_60_22]|nr:MAG: hypothetical protein A3J28_16185 [Acidobacteria bacterium RIFCSPLOWO2_12_FULL_60_22]